MKPRLLFAVSTLLAALGGPAPAADAPAPPAAAAVHIDYQKTVLPNGLEVILVEDHRLPIVAVNIWYHVGPANEAPGLTGFAHLFEHMMFAGTKHVPRGEADRLLEGAGATDSNGSTDFDRTNYYDTVPSNQLELALWVHADRMGYLLDVLDQQALSNQQDVVRNERRQSIENQPYGIVEEALYHTLFPKEHPYYASVMGSHADIQSARLADVRAFFTRYYGPNNASIVIAGDIDKARTLALVRKYFGGFKRSAPVLHPKVVTPPITRERRVVVPDRIELPRVFMGWLTPPAYQNGDAELEVLAQILAGGKSSRLYKSLVYERQIAQDANAAQNSYALTSTFVIDVTARPGHTLKEIEDAVDAELAALRDFGPSEREVERARSTIETRKLASIEKLGDNGLANLVNRYNQYLGDPGYLQKDLERLRRVRAQDVQRAARAWLQQGTRAVIEGVPGRQQLPPDVAAPPAKAGKTTTAGINRDEAWRYKAPKAGPAPRLTLPRADVFQLANGLSVIHQYNPALPLVAARLVVASGTDANPDDEPGLASFTAAMLDEGTATRSAPQIADEVAQLGAFLHTDSNADASFVSVFSLRSKFAQALDLLADVALNPAFPTAEVERQRASRLAELVQQRDEPEAVAAVAAAGALYGADHPYGYGRLGTEAATRTATREDLLGFWRSHYAPANAALVVAGDITRDELKALAEAKLAAWPRAASQSSAPGMPKTTRARLVLVDKPGAAQTALRVTAIAAERSTPDYPALEVMNAALGGLFSSRINNNLREQKGYSYGMFSQFRYDRTPGPFSIAGSVRTDVTGPSVSEIFKEVARMRDEPMAGTELAGARNSQILSLPVQFETNESIGASLADLFVFGLPADYYQQLPARYAAVTAQQAQQAARKYLVPEKMVVVAVGDRAKIAPQLDALKLGAPELRDSDGQSLP
ncbi:insulinase family protein [Massilia solisilvae]|uniref:Insulinase family protein n=1 Tax=Massilia solisilvae TaxID=1811225 RepID=A0ABT2BLL7_9BURK|nr:pitrilysin family protein [Massilia solisilvae]MCS0609367.1 insulinase family protein [Massilia solisilvae]